MKWPDLTSRSSALWVVVIADSIFFALMVWMYLNPHASPELRAELKGVFEGANGALFLALNVGRDSNPPNTPTHSSSVPVNGAVS